MTSNDDDTKRPGSAERERNIETARRLVVSVSANLNVLYGMWRGTLGGIGKTELIQALEQLLETLRELKALPAGSGIYHQYSVEQLNTTDLEYLRTALHSWEGDDLPLEISELAGDCVERLTGERLSEVESLARGSQATVPLGSALTRGIACLAALRDDNMTLFSPREARMALDDLIRVLPAMPVGDRKSFGVTVSGTVLADLAQLRQELHETKDGSLKDDVPPLGGATTSRGSAGATLANLHPANAQAVRPRTGIKEAARIALRGLLGGADPF